MDFVKFKKKPFGSLKNQINPDLGFDKTKACLNVINLQFPKSESYLEKEFQEKFFHSNINHIRNCHFYTIIFYFLAGFIDYLLFPDKLLPFFIIRFLVVSVFISGYFFSFSVNYKKNWREISFFYILLTGSSFIFFTALGQAPEAYDYWVGILFCMIFGYTFIREPFIYASVAGLILILMYFIVATAVTKVPTNTLIISLFYLLLINLLGMLISRHLEVSARKDFFLEHILFIERKKVMSLNNKLKKNVKATTLDLNLSNQLLHSKIEDLNKSEATNKHFINNAPIGMYSINVKGEFTFINKRLEEITGYHAEDWLGKSFHSIVYPADLNLVIENFRNRITGNKNPEPYQVRIINAQNKILSIKITSEPIVEKKDGIENIIGVQSFIEDVTKVKRSREINQVLFAIANAVTTTKNLSELYKKIHTLLGKIIDVTNFYIAIFNNKDHSLYFPYYQDIVDDDYSPIKNFTPERSLTGLVISKRKPILLRKEELENLAAKNNVWGTLALIWMGAPLMIKDEIIGVIAVQSYSTPNLYNKNDLEILASISDQIAIAIDRKHTEDELIKSEEKFRAVFKTSPYVITLTSVEDGIYIDINDAFTKLLGYSPKEILGKSSLEFDIWSDSRDRNRLVSGLQEAGIVENLQANFKGKDGQIINGLMSARTLNIENKKYLLAVTQDMTKIKEMEQERVDLEIRLQQAQKMEAIGTLAGGIAHDFNNILSGIFGYSQIALNKIENPKKVKDCIAQIDKGAKRAAELVRQILTFSRQDIYQKQPLQISVAIKEALLLLRSTIPTSIEIIERIDSKSTVLADPIKIHQLLINLCTNAYHAIGENNGNILISLTDKIIQKPGKKDNSQIPPGNYLELEVTDTGFGIEKSILGKIFDPYFTTKKIGQGTGFGLSLVSAIVKEHEGFIAVNSVPDQGTSFFVYFPVFQKNSKHISPVPKDQAYLDGNERVMVVDDEETIRDISKEILRSHGYDVSVFKNGTDALTEFGKDPYKYDLVITDMTMPKMSGDKLAIEILKKNPDIPILICTGFNEMLSNDEISSIGIKRILNKPLTMKDLLKNIRETLDENAIHK